MKQNTLSPVWNEKWNVKNVPEDTAQLEIIVMDKDEYVVTDDYVGKVKIRVTPVGDIKVPIEDTLFRRNRGFFSLKVWIIFTQTSTKAIPTLMILLQIESQPAADPDPSSSPYTFAGPIRFSCHISPTVGKFTNLNDARLYSTWKLYITGVSRFFGDQYQPWNRSYKSAQAIFQGPTSLAVRSGIQAGHRMLYARRASNMFGTIENKQHIFNLLHSGSAGAGGGSGTYLNSIGSFSQRIKPAVYTYIISADDDSFRFSETGAAFFVDFASKHALHSNCAEVVRYSGEFHPRPAGGWSRFSEDTPDDAIDWELVIDNNSGTYAPDKNMLPALKGLLEHNFEGFRFFALDHGDKELQESREACREYAMKYRGVRQDELQPHAQPDGDSRCHPLIGQQCKAGR